MNPRMVDIPDPDLDFDTLRSGIETELARTEYGPFAVFRDDHVGRWMLSGHHYEGDLLQWMIECIDFGDVVYDVGALYGTHAIPLAEAGAEVLAFEPQPEAYNLLNTNAFFHAVDGGPLDVEHLSLGNYALGHETAMIQMALRDTSNMGMAQVSGLSGGIVRMTTIDSKDGIYPDPHLIKIDVEGFEPAVVWGARETIERCRPIVVWEDNPPGLLARLGITDPDLLAFRVLDYLKSLGYRSFGNFKKNRWAMP